MLLITGGCHDDASLTVDELVAGGAAAYRNTVDTLRYVRTAIGYREFLEARQRAAKLVPPPGIDRQAAGRALASAASLTEREAKAVLAHYGLPVTQERLAHSAEEAVSLARAIGGPVALKVESPDIAHKTEAGAIRLGVEGEAAVREAHDAVHAAARRYRPDARIAGVLVQEMVPRGAELMLGLVHDPVFGPVLAVGSGGVFVEVWRDITYRVPPVDAGTAKAMLNELRGRRLLEGVRDLPAADLDAVTDAIVRLSWLAHHHRDRIRELDINPLVALAQGVKVVDALIVTPQSNEQDNQ